jgi:hypothetical protein
VRGQYSRCTKLVLAKTNFADVLPARKVVMIRGPRALTAYMKPRKGVREVHVIHAQSFVERAKEISW